MKGKPGTAGQAIMVTLRKDQWRWLRRLARKHEVSIAELVRQSVDLYKERKSRSVSKTRL